MKFLDSMKAAMGENSEEWLEVACKGQKKETEQLVEMKNELLVVYESYDAIIYDRNTSPGPSRYLSKKDILKKFYVAPPAELGKLLQKRRQEHGLDVCPYCGSPASPNTLDHFMPKDVWPELALYPNNLVPQCSSCGSIKGDRYYCDETNCVKYIHPIYFELLSLIRFSVEMSLEDVEGKMVPKFKVSILLTRECSEEDQLWLIKHFEELKIRKRVIEYCERTFGWLKRTCSTQRFPLKTFLKMKLDVADPIEGDWKSALFNCVMDNELVLEYLKELMPAPVVEQAEERILLMG